MKYYFLITILFLLLIKVTVSAQGVPAAYSADYNRMMSNNMLNMNMTRMMNQNWYRGLGYQVNNAYNFTLTMKDGSEKTVRSKIYADTSLHKSYLLFTNKDVKRSDPKRQQKIYADETVAIRRSQEGFGKPYEIKGIATDSCWLFQVINGKINGYSYLSEKDNLDESYLRAFQINDGRVTKIDSVELDPIIKADTKAYKPFLKGKFYKAIVKFNADAKK